MADITVRQAVEADLPTVAEIHIRAFPDSFLSRLGRGPVEKYYEWLLKGPHQTTALMAYADGKPAGFCFGGVFRGALSGFLKKNRYYLFLSLLARPAVFFHPEMMNRLGQGIKSLRAPAASSNMPSPGASSFGILSVAVDPVFQRSGAGRELMLESEKAAKRLGFREMDLTVHPENTKAVSFYKKAGWIEDREKPGSGRMRKSL